jgi:hypothetical protein
MRELRNKYAWADEDYDLAWTVAVVEGLDPGYLLALYGGSPAASLGRLTFAEAMRQRTDHFDDYSVFQILGHDRQLVAIEPNGWTGNMPEIARRATASGGTFFSVYWSPSTFQILQAKDGQVTGSFDPNFIGLPAGANDLLPGWVGDDDFPLEQLKASCMAAMEQQTGVAFDRAWLDKPLPTYRIPDPDALLKDVGNARLP